MQSRRQQLMEQLIEAQRLRDDFEATKARLLSGLQNHFFVLREGITGSDDKKAISAATENSVSHRTFCSFQVPLA